MSQKFLDTRAFNAKLNASSLELDGAFTFAKQFSSFLVNKVI